MRTLSLPRPAPPAAEPLWLEWLALAGLFAFASWLLGARGVWQLLLQSDPTGITFVIIVIFAASTVWCGKRARELGQQHGAMQRGEGWASERVTLSTHNGTHMDAPYHFHSTTDNGARRAPSIDETPLDMCFAPGVKLDFDLHGQKPGLNSTNIPVNSRIATAL